MKRLESMRILAVLALVLGFGCSSSEQGPGDPSASGLRIVAFAADQTALDFGQSATLSWRTSGASRIVLTEGDRPLLDSSTETSGILEVEPARSAVYTLTISDADGEKEASVEIGVRPAILAFTTEVEGEIPVGSPIAVSWKTGGATALTLSYGGDSEEIEASHVLEGTGSIAAPADGKITLIARSGPLETSAELVVQVLDLDAPAIAELTATPSVITAGAGEKVELRWKVSGADSLSLSASGAPVDVSGLSVEDDRVEIEVDESTTVLLEATNLAGTARKEVQIEALPQPTIETFAAIPSRIPSGGSFELRWSTSGATEVQLFEGSLPVDGGEWETNGDMVRSAAADTTYTLRALNAAGGAAEQELAVTIGGPIVVSFAPELDVIAPGTPLTLRWSCDGGTSMTILDPDGAPVQACTSSDPATVASGLCTTTAPSEVGRMTYTLVVEDDAREEARAQTIAYVSNGPEEDAATIAFDSPSVDYDPLLAEEATLSWTTSKTRRLLIWQLDPEGAPIEPPLLDTMDPARIDAGSLSVDPDASVTYLAAAENVFGDRTLAEASVHLLLAEIDSFLADPAEVVVGSSTNLIWSTSRADHVVLDYDASFSFEAGNLPFVELRDRPGAQELAIAGDCGIRGGVAQYVACPTLAFPDFTFPLGDQTFDAARVTVTGALTFARTGTGDSSMIETMPATLLPWDNLLAVLWNNFIADPARDSKLLYQFGEEDGRKNLIVEWSQVYPRGARGDCPASLSFQLFLWEDGSFDYRYGPFGDIGNRNCVALNASVGYYSRSSSQSAQVLYGAEPSGGLSGTSYSFKPTELKVDDSIKVPLSATRTFTLTAFGAKGSSASKTIEVKAWDLPVIKTVRVENPTFDTFYSMVGEPTTLSWTTADALALEVLDPSGDVVCSVQETSPLAGSCNVTSQSPGSIDFTLRAHGALGSHVDRIFPITFYPLLEITEFQVSPDAFEYGKGDQTTLSWKTVGASTFELLEDGIPVAGGIPSGQWASGSRVFTLDRTRTYTLALTADYGNEISATRTVDVLAVKPLQASASQAQTNGDEPVTLSWSTSTLGDGETYVTVEPSMVPMVEIVGTAPFSDISGTGAPIPGFTTAGQTVAGVVVDVPFPFPYFGTTYEKIKVGSAGQLSFDLNSQVWTYIYPFLGWFNTGSEKPHIAPYLADLRTYNVGNGYTNFVPGATRDQDQFIIQWTRMQLAAATVPAPGTETDNLTFQVVLFRSGDFDFRYGTMSSPSRPAEAGGARATAGYRKPGRQRVEFGDQLFYDLANPINFTNRTWRYRALKATDTLTLSPSVSTNYTICVEHRGDKTCEIVPVAVPAAGDLIVTELDLLPAGGSARQWFELRNLSAVPIDLAGMKLISASGTTTIASASPLVVRPGAYLTLAASAGVGFTPDYVYGTSSPLGSGIDGIRLEYQGRVVAELQWDERWTIPAAKTLSLDPVHHKLHSDAPTRFESFCATDAAGSPGRGLGCGSPYYVFDPYARREMIDISGTGVRIQQMMGSTYTFTLPGGLGFRMPFFGDTVDQVWASANGFAGFQGAPWAGPVSEPIPTLRGTGLVAGLWTPLLSLTDIWQPLTWFAYDKRVVDGQRVVVLHWERKRRYTSSGVPEEVGDVTIQIQLWENGDIVVIYPTMSGDPMHFGAGGTVGIESLDGSDGIQYLHEEASLQPGQVLLFEYHPGVTSGR